MAYFELIGVGMSYDGGQSIEWLSVLVRNLNLVI